MFTTTAQYVEEHTRKYWRLSSIRNGRIESRMNTGQAIRALNRLMNNLGPHRKLLDSAARLQDDIIIGVGKTTKYPPPQNILAFPQTN